MNFNVLPFSSFINISDELYFIESLGVIYQMHTNLWKELSLMDASHTTVIPHYICY